MKRYIIELDRHKHEKFMKKVKVDKYLISSVGGIPGTKYHTEPNDVESSGFRFFCNCSAEELEKVKEHLFPEGYNIIGVPRSWNIFVVDEVKLVEVILYLGQYK